MELKSKAPFEMNLVLALSLIFCIFYFFPSKKFVQTTVWFNAGFLTILALIGITHAFKTAIRNSTRVKLSDILLYIVMPFSLVIIFPILMDIINRKYYKYYKNTNESIRSIDNFSIINAFVLAGQTILLFLIYTDFINNASIDMTRPALLFVLFTINIGLTMYNYIVVTKMLTDG